MAIYKYSEEREDGKNFSIVCHQEVEPEISSLIKEIESIKPIFGLEILFLKK